jgi:hypothetical protein
MSKKEYPCIESRATFRVSGYTVRVWRIEKTVEEAIQASHEDIRHAVNEETHIASLGTLVRAAAACARVSGVEVIHDASDTGLVVYPIDFGDDVHG